MSEIPEEAKVHLRSGNKIAAIKVVREKTGVGLKEAKELVEAHVGVSPQGLYPEMNTVKINGSMLLTVFVIIGGIVYFLIQASQ